MLNKTQGIHFPLFQMICLTTIIRKLNSYLHLNTVTVMLYTSSDYLHSDS